MGRIEWNGQKAKPAREVSIGDVIRIRTQHGDFVVNVAGLSEVRGPAPVAQKLYSETPESVAARQKEREIRKATMPTEIDRVGKPSKRDRREIDRLRRR